VNLSKILKYECRDIIMFLIQEEKFSLPISHFEASAPPIDASLKFCSTLKIRSTLDRCSTDELSKLMHAPEGTIHKRCWHFFLIF
jgi:hypothetical protein